MRATTGITFLCALVAATPLGAQQPAPDARRPFEIADNSFLVEEAFNQEAGVVQNILVIQPPRAGAWAVEFTQEWPLGGIRHQLSYTVPLEGVKVPGAADYHVARGTLALHYRYQLTSESETGFASSPRLSVLIPRAEVADNWGLQLNLPFSKQISNLYAHFNAGTTVESIASAASVRWHAAGSVIFRVLPMVHAMLETVYRTDEHETATGSADDWVIAPGVRAGINLGDHQLVLGAAVPFGMLSENDTRQLIAYISYELPFMRR